MGPCTYNGVHILAPDGKLIAKFTFRNMRTFVSWAEGNPPLHGRQPVPLRLYVNAQAANPDIL